MAKCAQCPPATACPASSRTVEDSAGLWPPQESHALDECPKRGPAAPQSDVRRERVVGRQWPGFQLGSCHCVLFGQGRGHAGTGLGWGHCRRPLASCLETRKLHSGEGSSRPPPARAAFRTTSVNRCMHTPTAHHSLLGTHAHTHVRSISDGGRLLCRLHSAAVVAARAPGLCSGSSGSAVSGVLAWQLWGGQLCHPRPFAEFFARWLLCCFQLAFGGCWATG